MVRESKRLPRVLGYLLDTVEVDVGHITSGTRPVPLLGRVGPGTRHACGGPAPGVFTIRAGAASF